jgi:hypothetical protein
MSIEIPYITFLVSNFDAAAGFLFPYYPVLWTGRRVHPL